MSASQLRRMRVALYGVLGVHIAWFVLRLVRVLIFPLLNSAGAYGLDAIITVGLISSIVSTLFAVAEVVFAITYASALRGTSGRGLAQAAWLVLIAQRAAWYLPSFFLSESLQPVGGLVHLPGVVLGWVFVALFAGSAYRLLQTTAKPLAVHYVYLLVGSRVMSFCISELFDALVLQPGIESGNFGPSPLMTVFTVLMWGASLVGLGLLWAFVSAAASRLRTLPVADARVFD